MKIRDIISETSAENQAKLNRLRDLGKVELATRIAIYLGKVDDWDAAAEAARDDMDAGKPIPRSKDGKDTDSYFKVDTTKDKKIKQQPTTTTTSSRSSGWDDETHGHLRGDGKGTGAKIARALNPLSDLDSTDIGTTFTSALRKATGKMRNLDKFRIKK